MLFLCNIANVAQRTFQIVQNRDHANILIISTRTSNIHRLRARVSPETSTCEVPRDISRVLQLTLCVRKWRRRGKPTACLMVKLQFRLGRDAVNTLHVALENGSYLHVQCCQVHKPKNPENISGHN